MLVRKTLAIIIYLILTSINVQGQDSKDYFGRAIKYFYINIDSSIHYLQLGLQHYERQSNWESYVNCLNGLASCYSVKGMYNTRFEYIYQAYDEANLHLDKNQSEAYASALNNMAVLYTAKGEYQNAIKFYKNALEIDANKDNVKNKVSTLNNIGLCYFYFGDYLESKRYFKKALSLAESELDVGNSNRMRSSIRLANLYKEQNMLDTALQIYNQTLLKLKENSDKEIKISALNLKEIYTNKAEILLDQNDENNFNNNLKEFTKFHLKTYQSPSENISILYGKWALKNHQYENAIDHFNTALKITKKSNSKIKSTPRTGKIHHYIGRTHMANQELEKAEYHINLALNHYNILDQGNEWKQSLDDAVLNLEVLDIVHTKAKVHLSKFDISQKQDDLDQSEKSYQKAIELVNKIRLSFINRGSKENLLSKATQIFEGFLAILQIKYDERPTVELHEKIYEVFENSKAVILLESIKENNALGAGGIPDSLIQKEKELNQSIAYHKEKLAEISTDKKSIIKTISNNLFDLQKEHRELISVFESQYPKYFELKYNENFNSLSDGKTLINDNQTALLNYFVGDQHIYILAIEKDIVKFERITKPPNFNSQVDDLRKLISNPPNFENAKLAFNEFQNIANNLYNLLLAPIELSSDIEKLIVIPDDVLSYIPFEILLSKKNENPIVNYKSSNLDYLIKDYQITYLYSTSIVNLDHAPRKANENAIIGFAPNFNEASADSVANNNCSLATLSPLACNEYEAQNVVDLFDGKALIGSNANSQLFMEEIDNFRIAHFATHSCLNDEDPMLNKIFFSDGYISNYDLYNLELNNDLVVLSACNTGSGTLKRGEGVMSLSRGFIHAGCPSIIMSLWSVEDCTTADIMVNFYEELKKEKSKDQALQQSKLRYLDQANKLESHPFYWAPFVHIGSTDPLHYSSAITFQTYAILFAILAIGLLLFVKYKNTHSI